ncbi:hypothetical protein AB0F11_18285 [Streptomyces sp. NPDC032472]|uniref:hypothetical protein n=1 Tax=Streptomyces sp. NPDC032472 TaxID=3155018 RepID=UPI003405F18E
MTEAQTAAADAQTPQPDGTTPDTTVATTSPQAEQAVTTSPWERAIIRAMLWFSFSVILSLLPLFAAFIFKSTKGEVVTYAEVAGKGELLIITTGMAAAAAGDLWAKGAAKQWLTTALACLNTALAIFTTLWFGYLTALADEKSKVDQEFIATWSTTMFVISFLASGMSIIRAELRQ